MQAAMLLASYTPGESDDLRSAVSKKDAAKVKKHVPSLSMEQLRTGSKIDSQ